MAERFYNISMEEMQEFLEPQGFQPLQLDRTVELVWGKIVRKDNLTFSLRVYTGINPSGESRPKGEDAIRVMLFVKYNGDIRHVGKTRNCLRVNNWRHNIQAAINEWQDALHVCPACGAPQVERTKRSDKSKFWACLTYFETGCRGFGTRQPFNPVTDAVSARQEVTGNVQQAGRKARPRPSLPTQHAKRTKPEGMEIVKRAAPVRTMATAPVAKANPYRIPDHLLSDAQRAFELAFTDGEKHIVGGARAGSGKTTMLKHVASCRKGNEKWVYLAFGRKNAKEGREKMPRFVKSQTTHGFCSGLLRRAKLELAEEPNDSKTWIVLEDLYPSMENKARKRIRKAVYKLVGLCKNFACKPGDHAAIKSVFEQYTFELGGDDGDGVIVNEQEEIDMTLELTSEVLQLSLPGEKYGTMYDFDDMLWYVVMLNLDVPKVDVVLADEVQDFNACQIWLLRKLAAKGTRIIAVGDPYQAVFRFRGADCDAYYKVIEALTDTKRGMQECILPTNYRCGKAIIAHVVETTHVKDIEAAPDAIEGEVLTMSYDDILELLGQEAAAA